MNAKITVLVFSLLLGCITIANLATPPKAMSESENRTLQQMPKLNLSTVASGSFMEEFDTFVIDQFAFRDAWVGVKTISEQALGKSSSGGVYFAKDNYLIEMFDQLNTSQYEKNLAYVTSFSRRATEELDVNTSTILVPTASYVLSDRLPAFAPEVSQQDLLKQAEQQIPGFIDVSNSLAAHNDAYIYYRTDHHWTSLGAFYAYNEWRNFQGLAPRSTDEFQQEILSENFLGTTYSKANLYTAKPDTITAWIPTDMSIITVDYNNGQQISNSIYEYSYLEVKDKYSVFLNANQPLVQIQTGVNNGKKLLVIKDSYANTFIQFLLADYEEIYVVDLRFFRTSIYDILPEYGITDALILYNLKGFSSDANLLFLDR